jgi:uncharacterized protein (TIGR04255 family)
VEPTTAPDTATATWERFANAPITEALLDIRATLPSGVTLGTLATFQAGLESRFPNRRERRAWEGMVQLGPGGAVETRQKAMGPDGYLFTSADGRQIVQARLDGFTFNRLRPYVSWEALRDEAREHWDRYRQVARPEGVSRIALRYINRVDIPLAAADFKQYIRTAPEIAPGLPQGLAGFLMRLVVPMERFEATAIMTETMEAPKDDRLPFILDIDVVMEKSFSPDGGEMWQAFERLRDCKNTVFFESVTKAAKELFR